MQPIAFLYLSRSDVLATGINMAETIAIIENAFKAFGWGQFECPPKPGVHPQPDTYIHAMPAYLPEKGAAGLKWISGFSGNSKYGLPAVMGLMILNDVTTGQPLAVMEAGWLTAVRTAAASAVAARYLARKNAAVVGIVGAGTQGYAHALAMAEVLPGMQLLKLFDVNRDILDQCIGTLKNKLPGRVIESVDTAHLAIEGADVVITATSKLSQPVFSKQWIHPGALVLPIHTGGWDRDTPFYVDKFVVDYWEQFRNGQQKKGAYYPSLPPVYAELGEIVVGHKPGRENETEQIMNHNYGIGIHDVAMASAIYERAKIKKLGTELSLIQGDDSFF